MNITRRQALAGLAGPLVAAAQSSDPAITPGLCAGAQEVPGFIPYCFTDGARGMHQLYVADGGGPPVLLLHELPGLVDADLKTAQLIAARKYTVIAPLFFGTPGGSGHTIHNYKAICGPNEFACHEANATSTHVCWLRRLCGLIRQRWAEGQGLGVIGMCLTGAFPIALMSEPSVVAPVVCQPTTPVNFWTFFGLFTNERALGLYPKDLELAKAAAQSRKVPILGIRYKDDPVCRKPRFERLTDEFGSSFYRLDLPGKHRHSTLAIDRCNEAFDEVAAFLNRFLRSTPMPADSQFPLRSKAGSKEEVVVKGICAGSESTHAG
jgi:dienelactone hydrolase